MVVCEVEHENNDNERIGIEDLAFPGHVFGQVVLGIVV